MGRKYYIMYKIVYKMVICPIQQCILMLSYKMVEKYFNLIVENIGIAD